MDQLRDLAVLVSLRMSTYGATTQDSAATDKLNAEHGATKRVHKVSRDRLAGTKAGEVLERIRKAQSDARTTFGERTVPWDDKGRRMCSNTTAADLWQLLGKQRGRIDALVGEFVAAWPDAETEARRAQNGGWREEYATDYRIDPEEMRGRFAFAPSMESMPSADDIRIDAPAKLIQQAREEAEGQMQEKFRAGCRDVHARFLDALQVMHDRLADPKATFRDTLFGNLRDLCDLLPALNIGKDPDLDRIGAEARRRLLAFDMPALPGMSAPEASTEALAQRARDDTRHRAKTATAAADILSDLRAYMGRS